MEDAVDPGDRPLHARAVADVADIEAEAGVANFVPQRVLLLLVAAEHAQLGNPVPQQLVQHGPAERPRAAGDQHRRGGMATRHCGRRGPGSGRGGGGGHRSRTSSAGM